MRAVVLREFGPPERLVVEERDDPRPGPGELVVAVQVASITFVETQIRAGRPPHPAMAQALPAVLGNGVGGGRFSAYGMASGAFTALDGSGRPGVTTVRRVPLTSERMRALSTSALAQAAAGRLTPTIGQTFALADADQSHAAIESRATIGKTLLVV